MSILARAYRKLVILTSHLDPKQIRRYRQFDAYVLDHEVFPSKTVFVSSKLPSEPPEGFTYEFGPSGYDGSSDSNYCVIPTTWWNINNYCHWSFSELPFLFLAFESKARNIVLPKSIINAKLPFQKAWMELLHSMHPDKNIIPYTKKVFPVNSLIPVNHDTSSSTKPFGKCLYRHYHISRATPYLIERVETEYQKHLYIPSNLRKQGTKDFIYINRKTRRLKNEEALQALLKALHFHIVDLEDMALAEQVTMFSEAKMVIGFHGAGLSNLLYASASTTVFEIVDKDFVYPCYLDGIVIPGKKATRTYFHMLCEMKNITYRTVQTQDYVLDLRSFETRLTKAIS